jgi:hypothetical protein
MEVVYLAIALLVAAVILPMANSNQFVGKLH